ncbi:MAG TPA: hypothetical protein VE907_18285 [Gammaproteobacteria bacterium]|nr:hypothetical protein [Gammaproteobacteria bacterium]
MKHRVFLVHGTWGRSETAWYHSSSAPTSFQAKLKAALARKGIRPEDVVFVPFEWKGENTHADRLEAAASLASKLVEQRTQDADTRFHFVAHSHGGNVVLKAIEIYLNDLAWVDVPQLIDTRDIVEVSLEFLRDHAAGKYRLHSDKELNRLVGRLADTLEVIDQRRNKRLRIGIADGSIWDLERSALRHILGRLFTHVYSLPEHHRIGTIVTLGTPFYEKRWTLGAAERGVNWLFHRMFFLPAVAGPTYFCIIVLGALAAATPWVSWIGFNPLNWPWLLLAIGGLASLWFAYSFAKLDTPELPRDTNVYFDEAVIPYYVHVVEPIKLCRVLNVHASYLDEAYCVLSAYPLLSVAITKRLANIVRPRFWEFKRPSPDVGFWRLSPPALMRRKLKELARIAIAITKAIAYPVRLAAHAASARYLARRIAIDLRVFGYGLPPDESHRRSSVSVENVLRKPYFETHVLDLGRVLSVLPPSAVDPSRFAFLWNDDDLVKRVQDSILVRGIDHAPTSEECRKLVALEERVREFFGVVGLRHSMYYDNDVVINAVAEFLAGDVPTV